MVEELNLLKEEQPSERKLLDDTKNVLEAHQVLVARNNGQGVNRA